MAPRYKLKLKQLDFISLVDDPAQPNAKCLLIKRKGSADEVSATARLVKTADELGLAFFWAFTSTNTDGTDHFDLHGDAVQADNDMIKAAAEFMEKGGAVDEMHDSDPDGGRVVFAMPMTPDIASAFGVTTKTSGLMIAIRPSADAMAKLKDGTYRAVSIAGLGERIEMHKSVAGARKKLKAAIARHERHMSGTEATSEKSQQKMMDEMKAALAELDVNQDDEMDMEKRASKVAKGSLFATMADAQHSHSHGIVFEDGKLTILADSGHTHELSEGQGGVVVVPQDAIVLVQASASPTTNASGAKALAAKSTRPATKPHNEDTMKIVILSEAQQAHYSKLSGDDAEAFIAKSFSEREAVLGEIAKADPVVYTTKSGLEVRKSHGNVALELAKQADENAKALASQAAEIAKRDEAIEKAEVRKLAADVLAGVAGDDDTHDYIVKSVRKGGGDAAMIDKALATLRSSKEFAKQAAKAKGFGGTEPSEGDAVAKFNTELATFAKSVGKPVAQATEAFLNTAEGAALYAATRQAPQA